MRSVILILSILGHAPALQAQEPSPAEIEKRFKSHKRVDWISAIAGSQAFLETRAEAGSVIAALEKFVDRDDWAGVVVIPRRYAFQLLTIPAVAAAMRNSARSETVTVQFADEDWLALLIGVVGVARSHHKDPAFRDFAAALFERIPNEAAVLHKVATSAVWGELGDDARVRAQIAGWASLAGQASVTADEQLDASGSVLDSLLAKAAWTTTDLAALHRLVGTGEYFDRVILSQRNEQGH